MIKMTTPLPRLRVPGGNIGPHWQCGACQNPISDGEGFVAVLARDPRTGEVGGYPRMSTPAATSPRHAKGLVPAADLVLEALAELASPPFTIAFAARHDSCATEAERAGYHIAVDQAPSLERWVGWMLHLEEKSWMGHRDAVRLLTFWWTHAALELPRAA